MYTRIISSLRLTKPSRLLPSRHRLNLYPYYPQSRALHATALVYRVEQPKGQAPPASREPKEDTLLEQNPHLKHAVTSQGGLEGRDVGKGNADPERPTLPSHKVSGKKVKKEEEKLKLAKGKAKGKGKRGLHTSAVWSADTKGEDGEEKHTAESYFKDVDQNPPSSSKTFVVDGSAEATPSSSSNDEGKFRPATHRPHEQYADPTKEYATVSKDKTYEAGEMNEQEKGEQKEQNLGYGATNGDALRNAPKGDEGPQDKHAGGVKPERSS